MKPIRLFARHRRDPDDDVYEIRGHVSRLKRASRQRNFR